MEIQIIKTLLVAYKPMGRKQGYPKSGKFTCAELRLSSAVNNLILNVNSILIAWNKSHHKIPEQIK